VKNEDYWKPGLPRIDELYFRIIPDAASRAVAFEKGTVDVLRGGDVEGFEVRRLSKLDGVQTTTDGWEMYSPLAFIEWNLRRPPFNNKLARKAIMHAIDRDFIVRNIWFGLGKTAVSPFASTTRFFTDDVVKYPFDMAKAKELLAQSGIKPQEHTIRVMPIPYGAQWDRTAEYVKQQLEQLGFKAELVSIDAGGWSKAVSDWDFDLTFNYTYQYGDPALGVARHYLSSNIIKGTPFANNEGYENPVVDELFLKAASAVDEAEAKAAYAEAQKIITDDMPLGLLFEQRNVTIWRDKVKELVRTGIGVNESMDETWIAQ